MLTYFDEVASVYAIKVPAVPKQYIQLIHESFEINKHDKVVDLGCGAGLLTFPLSEFSNSVIGVDSSNVLINIARIRDVHQRIAWIHKSVENFHFEDNTYKLLISFDAFHLFSDQADIVRKCLSALKSGGFFSVGWREFEWEFSPVVKEIVGAFFGDFRDNYWDDWFLPKFAKLLDNSNISSSTLRKKTIEVESSTKAEDIVAYLFSSSLISNFNKVDRVEMKQELEERLTKSLPTGGKSIGISRYSLVSCVKL